MSAPTLRDAPRPASPVDLIDRFLACGDVDTCHEVVVRAPAAVVMDVARTFDMQSIPAVRGIFWLRSFVLHSHERPRPVTGLLAETLEMGWGLLAERPGRELVIGAVAQPWLANVRFRAVPPAEFAAFAEPDQVKIVWTIEVVPLRPRETLLRTRTRALATDPAAHRKFLDYWRKFGSGSVMIRWLLLPAVRRAAERCQRAIDAREDRLAHA